MTTETENTPPAPAPAMAGGLSPERLAASREKWVNHGLDPAKFDAVIAGQNAPPSPATGQVATKPRPDVPSNMPSLSPERAASMAARLRLAGVAEDRITAAMQADGIIEATPEQLEAAKHDADYGFGKIHAPAEYKIDYGPAGRGVDAGELATLNGQAQNFLAALEMPPAMGAGLVERVMTVGQALDAMEPAARQSYIREQRALGLRKSGGDEAKLAETVRLASVAMKHAGPSDFRDMVLTSNGAHDWFVIATLANHGAQIERWQASRPGKKS